MDEGNNAPILEQASEEMDREVAELYKRMAPRLREWDKAGPVSRAGVYHCLWRMVFAGSREALRDLAGLVFDEVRASLLAPRCSVCGAAEHPPRCLEDVTDEETPAEGAGAPLQEAS